MKQETRTSLAVFGGLLACIGFFLPWVTITISSYSISISGADLARVPNGGYYWIFFVAPLLVGIFAMVTGMKSTEGVKYLIRLLHGSHSVVVLLSIYQVVVSGTYREALIQLIYQSNGNNAQSEFMVANLNTSLAAGFGVVVVGLLLSGIAIYSPAAEGAGSIMSV